MTKAYWRQKRWGKFPAIVLSIMERVMPRAYPIPIVYCEVGTSPFAESFAPLQQSPLIHVAPSAGNTSSVMPLNWSLSLEGSSLDPSSATATEENKKKKKSRRDVDDDGRDEEDADDDDDDEDDESRERIKRQNLQQMVIDGVISSLNRTMHLRSSYWLQRLMMDTLPLHSQVSLSFLGVVVETLLLCILVLLLLVLAVYYNADVSVWVGAFTLAVVLSGYLSRMYFLRWHMSKLLRDSREEVAARIAFLESSPKPAQKILVLMREMEIASLVRVKQLQEGKENSNDDDDKNKDKEKKNKNDRNRYYDPTVWTSRIILCWVSVVIILAERLLLSSFDAGL